MDIKQQIYQLKNIDQFFAILSMYQTQWDDFQGYLAQEIRYLTSAITDNEHKLSVAIALYLLKKDRQKLKNLIANQHLWLKLTKTTDLCSQTYQDQPMIDNAGLVSDLLSQAVFNNQYGLQTSISICFQYFPNQLEKVYQLLSTKQRYLADIIDFILSESSRYQRDDGILDYLDQLFITQPISAPKGHIYCRHLKYWYCLPNIPKYIKEKIYKLSVKWLNIILEKPDVADKLMVSQESGLVIQILLAVIAQKKSQESFVLLKRVLENSTLVIGFRFEAMMYAYDLYDYIPDNKLHLITKIAEKETCFPTGYYEGQYSLEQFLVNEQLCSIESLLLIAQHHPHHYEAYKALKQREDIVAYIPQIIDALIDIIGNIIAWMIDGTYKYYHLQYVGHFLDFLLLHRKAMNEHQQKNLFSHLYTGLLQLQRPEIVGYYICFAQEVPKGFESLINPWRRHQLVLAQKNLTLVELYPKLIKALVISSNEAGKTQTTDFHSLIAFGKNCVQWSKKDSDTSRFEWFSELVKINAPDLELEELETDSECINDSVICLNEGSLASDDSYWPYYFQCQGQTYCFRLSSQDIRAIAVVVDNWMKMLGRPARCYELFYLDDDGHDEFFFSADPQYFQKLIEEYAIPAKRIDFFS